MKNSMLILMVFASAFSVVACNTVQGVGKDIQKGGEAIERVAR
ncbi:MAG TPA: entericidin A/B family lipoprotein [Accumulibacter sp.]|jgi:predicted small secreted protein|nr:entericidin A/B family lipoprotein [Accumulibacter sp.]HQC81585.1 entericidin A/B family lipoprotein [Accumulibacter sp.]